MTSSATALSPDLPRISVRDNWWVFILIVVLIAAIQTHLMLFLYYVHVFTAILWTGTDIFMGFILGPILRRVDFPTRRAIISRLMPRMLFYMPTMAAVTTTAGFFLAQWRGFFNLPYPQAYWVVAALVVVAILTVQGLGVLLPTNLRVYFEIRKESPDGAKIKRLMGIYVKAVGSQALMQFAIIFIMVKFRLGL